MRLSIAGIPPLASHTAVLLVGFALAHLESGQGLTGSGGSKHVSCFRSLSATTILAALPAEAEPPRDVDLGKPPVVFAVRTGKAGGCRVVEPALRLYARTPRPVVATSWDGDGAEDFLALVRAGRAGELKLTPTSEGAVLPLCHRAAQVTYGPPT